MNVGEHEQQTWGYGLCRFQASAPFPQKPNMKEELPTLEGLEIERLAGFGVSQGSGSFFSLSRNTVYFLHYTCAPPGAGKHLAGTHSAGSRASAGQRDHCAGQQNWHYKDSLRHLEFFTKYAGIWDPILRCYGEFGLSSLLEPAFNGVDGEALWCRKAWRLKIRCCSK